MVFEQRPPNVQKNTADHHSRHAPSRTKHARMVKIGALPKNDFVPRDWRCTSRPARRKRRGARLPELAYAGLALLCVVASSSGSTYSTTWCSEVYQNIYLFLTEWMPNNEYIVALTPIIRRHKKKWIPAVLFIVACLAYATFRFTASTAVDISLEFSQVLDELFTSRGWDPKEISVKITKKELDVLYELYCQTRSRPAVDAKLTAIEFSQILSDLFIARGWDPIEISTKLTQEKFDVLYETYCHARSSSAVDAKLNELLPPKPKGWFQWFWELIVGSAPTPPLQGPTKPPTSQDDKWNTREAEEKEPEEENPAPREPQWEEIDLPQYDPVDPVPREPQWEEIDLSKYEAPPGPAWTKLPPEEIRAGITLWDRVTGTAECKHSHADFLEDCKIAARESELKILDADIAAAEAKNAALEAARAEDNESWKRSLAVNKQIRDKLPTLDELDAEIAKLKKKPSVLVGHVINPGSRRTATRTLSEEEKTAARKRQDEIRTRRDEAHANQKAAGE